MRVYLKSIEIPKVCKRLASLRGKIITFDKGLNFLVGENGIGKSTILDSISKVGRSPAVELKCHVEGEKLRTYFFDTEKMNPRMKSYVETGLDVAARFQSHGQALRPCIEMLQKIREEKGDFLILIDEPESGLSPWTQVKIRELFVDLAKDYQLIVSTHSTILVKANEGIVIHLDKKVKYSSTKEFDWEIV